MRAVAIREMMAFAMWCEYCNGAVDKAVDYRHEWRSWVTLSDAQRAFWHDAATLAIRGMVEATDPEGLI